jgi:hypothetical protein
MHSMSLSPGQVVRARVTQVAVFGLFMDFRGHAILVLIPETSWTACYASCAEIADVGDEFDVSILKWVEERNQYAGSIRAVHPESDPWSGGWSLHAGDRLRATVVRSVDRADRCGDRPGYLLRLRPAAYAMVCKRTEGEWQVGRDCEVTVTAVNLHRREILVG